MTMSDASAMHQAQPAAQTPSNADKGIHGFWADFDPKQWETDVGLALHAIRDAMRDAPAPPVQPAQPAAPTLSYADVVRQ